MQVFPFSTRPSENYSFYMANLVCFYSLKGWKFLLLARQNFWRRYWKFVWKVFCGLEITTDVNCQVYIYVHTYIGFFKVK